MTRAIAPSAIPSLPANAIEWRRSSRRGSVYHAHIGLGFVACRSAPLLDRHKSEASNGIGDMQYWGVCPRCFAKGKGEQ